MYSPKHDIFFIHIPKCAGSSIDVALFRENGIDIPEGAKLKAHVPSSLCDQYYFFGKNRDAHARPRDLVGHKEFDNASYKFAIVRNPWDRFVSEYHWRKRQPRFRNIKPTDLINSYRKSGMQKEYAHTHFMPQWQYIFKNDKSTMMVDEFFKLETDMDRLLETLRNKTGNPDFSIPTRNVSKRDRDYRSFFDNNLKKELMPAFKDDMELFGYEF